MAYSQYLKTPHWKSLRKQVIERDRCCIICQKRGENVHHMVYRKLLNVTPDDLVFLCQSCHTNVHAAINAGLLPRGRRCRDKMVSIDYSTIPKPGKIDWSPVVNQFSREDAQKYLISTRGFKIDWPMKRIPKRVERLRNALLTHFNLERTKRKESEKNQKKLNLAKGQQNNPVTVAIEDAWQTIDELAYRYGAENEPLIAEWKERWKKFEPTEK